MVQGCTLLALDLPCFDKQDYLDEYQAVCFPPFHLKASFLCCFLVHTRNILRNLKRNEMIMSSAYSISDTYFFTTFFQDESTNIHLFWLWHTDNRQLLICEVWDLHAVYQYYGILECNTCSLVDEYVIWYFLYHEDGSIKFLQKLVSLHQIAWCQIPDCNLNIILCISYGWQVWTSLQAI